MKIAVVVSRFPEVSETFVLHQVTGLLDLGHDVQIVSTRRPNDEVTHAAVEEYDLLSRTHYISMIPVLLNGPGILARLVLGRRGGAKKALDALRLTRKTAGIPDPRSVAVAERLLSVLSDSDIIHCHFGRNGLAALPAAEIESIPLTVTFHGFDVQRFAQKHGKQVYDPIFERAGALLCVSDFLREQVIEMGAPPQRTITQYINSSLTDIPFRERSLQDGEPIRVITVARLVHKKGLPYSIQAVARLVDEGADVRYSIIGDGPLREELMQVAEEAGIAERVTFHGFMPRREVLELLDSAHLFVLSSVTASGGDTEGMPVVLREAQAAGLPVVTTDHAGNPEAIRDGESGFVVPERDVDALAERLGHLIENPELWPQMGQAGRELVEEQFDLRTLNRRLLTIFENLIAGRPPTAGLDI